MYKNVFVSTTYQNTKYLRITLVMRHYEHVYDVGDCGLCIVYSLPQCGENSVDVSLTMLSIVKALSKAHRTYI